jgi:hypothetical protein
MTKEISRMQRGIDGLPRYIRRIGSIGRIGRIEW